MQSPSIYNPHLGTADHYYRWLYQSGKYSDVTVILKDEHQNIKLNLHKNIISMIPYFEMLIGNDQTGIIEANVPFAKMSQAIIETCYCIPLHCDLNSREAIYYLISCNFMSIDCGYHILDNLETIDYDQLLVLASQYEYDDYFLKLLIKHLPEDYDLGKISKELLLLMRDKTFISPFDYFAKINYVCTDRVDILGNMEPIFYFDTVNNSDFGILRDKSVYFTNDDRLAIVDNFTNSGSKFSQDGKHFAIMESDRVISVYHAITRKEISKFSSVWGDKIINCGMLDNILIYVAPYKIYVSDMITKDTKVMETSFPFFPRAHTVGFVLLPSDTFLMISCRSISIVSGMKNSTPELEEILLPGSSYCPFIGYAISGDYRYLVIYQESCKNLSVYDLDGLDKCMTKKIDIESPLIYFSKDDRHIIFRNRSGYSYVSITHEGLSDLMTENIPEKRLPDFRTNLTERIDLAL